MKETAPKSTETTQERIAELPVKSADNLTSYYLREIKRSGNEGAVVEFISQQLSSEAKPYDSAENFLAANPDYLQQTREKLSDDQKQALRNYSSYNFAWINSVERGFWDYDKLGRKTPEKEAQIRETSRNVDRAICAAPAPQEDFVTYRGTDLSGFGNFGVHSLEDLAALEGQMMVERGYTSTAIDRSHSFVEEEGTLWLGQSNIEMRYRIPGGKKTCVAMLDETLSHSPQQTEVLLNRGMMSYISKVEYDKPGHATIDAVVVPFELYDPARVERV